jgi:hypothetical protein
LICAVLAFLIHRPKSGEDEDNDKEAELSAHASEMDNWSEFSASTFEGELFSEYENMLDPEAQVGTFANGVFDEAGFGSFVPLGNIFGQ